MTNLETELGVLPSLNLAPDIQNPNFNDYFQKLAEQEFRIQTFSQMVDVVLTYKSFSNGTYFYEECAIEDMEFFEIDGKVREQAPKEGIVLDSSSYAGMAIGLPYNCPYIVWHKKRK